MSNQPIASVPGIELYKDGIEYSIADSQPGQLTIAQRGFIPLRHISQIEIRSRRSFAFLTVICFPSLLFLLFLIENSTLGSAYSDPPAGLLVFAVIGIIVGLALFLLVPIRILTIYSHGHGALSVPIGGSLRDSAIDMINKYRRLKYIAEKRESNTVSK